MKIRFTGIQTSINFHQSFPVGRGQVSGELNDHSYKVLSNHKKSTGRLNDNDLPIVVVHCTTNYPKPPLLLFFSCFCNHLLCFGLVFAILRLYLCFFFNERQNICRFFKKNTSTEVVAGEDRGPRC
jgi:hypothetical protein